MLTESNAGSGLRHSKPLSTTRLCVGVPPPVSAAPKSLSLKSAAGTASTLSLRVSSAPALRQAALTHSSTAVRWVAPGKGGPWQPGAKGSRSCGWGPTSPPHLMVRGEGLWQCPAGPDPGPPPASEGQWGGPGGAGRRLLKVNEGGGPRAGRKTADAARGIAARGTVGAAFWSEGWNIKLSAFGLVSDVPRWTVLLLFYNDRSKPHFPGRSCPQAINKDRRQIPHIIRSPYLFTTVTPNYSNSLSLLFSYYLYLNLPATSWALS